jgi:hypothetical protein
MGEKAGPETDARPGSSRPVLSSWKEIARHFQIDVRTCQRWEKSFGLPVHRMDRSSRSRVIAYPDELERWHSQIYKAKSGETAVPEAAPASRPAKRKRFLFLVLPVTAVLLLGTIIGIDRVPDGFRIRGSRLIIANKFGLRLWSYETSRPDLEQTAFYRERFQEKRYVPDSDMEMPRFPLLLFRDLDGDGKKEILFAPETTGDSGGGDLFLFDSGGRQVWEFQSGQDVRIGPRDYPPNFSINLLDVQDFDADGRLEILIGTHCFNESPTRIVLLDLKKNVLGEYWHFGQLPDYAMGPVGPKGKSEIVFVGQNNEFGCPILLVLDPLQMRGCSPQSPASAFAGKEKGTERCYIRFPNTEIDRLRMPRGTLSFIKLQANGHFLLQTRSQLRVDFDPSFQSPQIIPTDNFSMAFDKAYNEKLIDHPFERKAFSAAYLAQIRYFDGRSWVSHPAQAPAAPAAQPRPQPPRR